MLGNLLTGGVRGELWNFGRKHSNRYVVGKIEKIHQRLLLNWHFPAKVP